MQVNRIITQFCKIIKAVPSNLADEINHAIGAFKFANGEYIVPCRHMDTMPNIDFTLNGVTYTLEPKDYVMKVGADGQEQSSHSTEQHQHRVEPFVLDLSVGDCVCPS